MVVSSAHHIMIVLIMLLCCLRDSWGSNTGVGESKVMCTETERRTLLDIKAGLYTEYGLLSSWGEEDAKKDCCKWLGIRCNNNSGRVVRLDLSPSTFNYYSPTLKANISSSLVHLEYLNYLDLSGLHFINTSIPSFIGNLSKLRYLDLSNAGLSGQIPPQLGNLSNLEYLNLSNAYYDPSFRMKNPEWLSRLSSLRVLDLSFTHMSTAYDWAHIVTNLPHLTKMALQGCSLPNIPLSFLNSSKALVFLDLSQNSLAGSISKWLFSYSLEYLSLSSNFLEGSIPKSLGNITTLRSLYLSNNNLEGSIPKSLGNIATLKSLYLSNNKLEGSIPTSIWQICTLSEFEVTRNNLSGKLILPQSSSTCDHSSLQYLDLGENQFAGSLPDFSAHSSLIAIRLSSNRFKGNVSESINQLPKLEFLEISNNLLEGVMSEAHFSKLFSLRHLDLSNNPSLVLNISPHWIPPFQLYSIKLGSCQLGPHFPKWLQTQKRYHDLDISNSQITEPVPNWFWNASPDFRYMNLSYNQISGSIQTDIWVKRSYKIIDLTSNQFEGSIPRFLFQVEESRLSNNKFSSLSSLCDAEGFYLKLLDISFNNLEGDLPECWSRVPNLMILNLANNKISGKIPDIHSSSLGIRMLHLGNNNFTGKLPLSLRESNGLQVLDLGGNRLSGLLPTWIGDYESLIILNLRDNRFNGSIPSSVCHLSSIQLLDLSINNFSGRLPTCIDNLTALTKSGNHERWWSDWTTEIGIDVFHNGSTEYYAQVSILWKGNLVQYKNTLGLVKSIDFSSNNLAGEIPKGITDLDGLVALNLSRNKLTGQIPTEIGNLKSLDVLDLSKNHLSGSIPSSLSGISLMNTLDVSHNNLSGKIPTSTQLQSFNAATYSGNPELCGNPLPKCSGEEKATPENNGEYQDSFITGGFYVALGLGFVVGFWGICGSLLFIKPWRFVYFMFLNRFGDWIFVKTAVHKDKLMKIIKN